MRKFLGAALAALSLFCLPAFAQTQVPQFSRIAGEYMASKYNWGYGQVRTTTAVAVGAGTITMSTPYITLQDGNPVYPFAITAPITIDQGSAVSETVTPTAVSGCSSNAPNATCTITATFANAHGPSASVTSGTFGLQEAINDAAGFGQSPTTGTQLSANGGLVVVDKSWPGTSSQIAGNAAGSVAGATPTGNAIVMSNVSILDVRGQVPVYWTAEPTASTVLTAPAVLTAASAGNVNGAATTGGFYTNANAYVICIAAVDIMGQESQCSPTYSYTPAGGSTNTIGFTVPPAQTGGVGYTIYISLTNGTYQLAYKVPLVTQPTVIGAYPVSNGVCTLTTLETTTPACALPNTAYGQTGSGALVAALTLNTSPIDPQVTITSSTTVYVPQAGGRQVYGYVPGLHPATPGLPASTLPFTIAAAPLTVVPTVIGTINVPPGFMNYVGRTIEVCGFATTTATASTIEDIQFQWDSMGQNTAGKGVALADLTATTTLASTGHIGFCQDFETTVASASATGGSINAVNGNINVSGVSIAGTNAAGTNTVTGATGSLNLAADARINVIYLHTTATDGAGYILQHLSVKVIN